MKNTIIGAIATGCAAVSLGLAAPASADLAPGNYHHRSIMANGIVTENLMRVTSCGPGCISIFNLTSNTDQGQAHIQGNQYVLDQFVEADGVVRHVRAIHEAVTDDHVHQGQG